MIHINDFMEHIHLNSQFYIFVCLYLNTMTGIGTGKKKKYLFVQNTLKAVLL